MRELSLHILDIVQNSLRAGAKLIKVEIEEDIAKDILVITITDDGCGMDQSLQKLVVDPFTTTRTTRKVGLGIPLLKMATEVTAGDFSISSQVGGGTVITASFKHSHIDRMPLGAVVDTILSVIMANPSVDLVYSHCIDGHAFGVDTRRLKAEVGEEALALPEVIGWLRSYLEEGKSYLMEVCK